jgi:three-Cys-motif partner protein
MGSTKNFFKKKHEWSKLKDEILGNYLKPYLEKIKLFQREIAIFDCFAGKGRFDDGASGSPLIILNQMATSSAKDLAHAYFIEKKYSKNLGNNVVSHNGKYDILDDNYQANIQKIKNICRGKNVFLYVDPYGIKSLDFDHFRQLKESGSNTIELLLNFNTYGFLREGCRLLLHPQQDDDVDTLYEEDDTNTIDNMNNIANGDYWQKLLHSYYGREAFLKDIEKDFSKKYESELKKIFDYVLNIPILTKSTNIPKYRMYYGTNSKDGLFLMVDQMNKTWKNVLQLVNNGQQDLFSKEAETSISNSLQVFSPIDFKLEVSSLLSPPQSLDMKDLFVKIAEKCGITYTCSDFRKEIRKLEQDGFIKIIREFETTSTGKPSIDLGFEKNTIFIEEA